MLNCDRVHQKNIANINMFNLVREGLKSRSLYDVSKQSFDSTDQILSVITQYREGIGSTIQIRTSKNEQQGICQWTIQGSKRNHVWPQTDMACHTSLTYSPMCQITPLKEPPCRWTISVSTCASENSPLRHEAKATHKQNRWYARLEPPRGQPMGLPIVRIWRGLAFQKWFQ